MEGCSTIGIALIEDSEASLENFSQEFRVLVNDCLMHGCITTVSSCLGQKSSIQQMNLAIKYFRSVVSASVVD